MATENDSTTPDETTETEHQKVEDKKVEEGSPKPNSENAKKDDTTETLGEAGQKALAEERKARKAAEKAAKDFEARLKAIEDASLSEQEKVQRERDELKSKYESLAREVHEARAEKAITAAARQAGADGDNLVLVTELISADDYDEDSDNAADLVKTVKSRFPNLFKTTAGPVDTSSGKGAPPSSGKSQMGAWLRNS